MLTAALIPAANAVTSVVRDRMPVIPEADAYDLWLRSFAGA